MAVNTNTELVAVPTGLTASLTKLPLLKYPTGTNQLNTTYTKIKINNALNNPFFFILLPPSTL